MAKIALVSIMWKDRFIEEVGIQIIAAVLKKNTGHEIEIFYKFPKENYEDFYKRLITYKPAIVGFSLSHKYTGLEPLYAGVKELKEELGDVNIFIGGVFASTNAENILEKIPQVDCVFLGESENNIVEYIECITHNKNIDHIDGIVFRNTMQITRNPKKNYIFDLDSLPFADRTFMETDEYKQTVFKRANIAGSRGCHGKCHFCNAPSMYNAYDVPWRGRSVKKYC